MKNVTKKLSGVTLGLMIAGGTVGIVQADVFNATATVSSTITLVENTALDLGELYVTADANGGAQSAGTQGTFRLNTDGTVGATNGTAETAAHGIFANGHVSKFVQIGTSTVGVIRVTGASPFNTVTVSHGALTALTHSSANPALPTIEFTAMVTNPADTATLLLDASGDGDILVGGLFTAGESDSAYADGVYTGTYEINVAY